VGFFLYGSDILLDIRVRKEEVDTALRRVFDKLFQCFFCTRHKGFVYSLKKKNYKHPKADTVDQCCAYHAIGIILTCKKILLALSLQKVFEAKKRFFSLQATINVKCKKILLVIFTRLKKNSLLGIFTKRKIFFTFQPFKRNHIQ